MKYQVTVLVPLTWTVNARDDKEAEKLGMREASSYWGRDPNYRVTLHSTVNLEASRTQEHQPS